ncbi:branched-chain amino acid ABC transporter permease [Actinokineospora iranica]|uniref:Amino acid/amide ABC transporter membrane protein 1, HAAT family n=1 Tax=Actinokineospora iranica TaxID=1271860 RepID=A0A1G6QFC5_9PSEU|nr:branched-chain amino acid ABC transporter permease [Actinokineospora iranica]SDC91202.1 amino acid/amide ABC transporter membrane protein 1, HAAT family [Actinokineospora iranica]
MIQVLVNGVFLGCLFAVVAVGLTLVYGVMEVPNFAHAGVIVLAAYATWSASAAGLPFALAALVGIACGAAVSVLTEVVAYRWIIDNPAAAPAVALGLMLILQNTALRLFGGEGRSMDTPYDQVLVEFGGVSLSGVKVALVVLAVLALTALHLILSRTSLGRAMRAVAQDRGAAAMLGIPMRRQYTLAFLIAGLLAGIAAVAYAPTFQVSPYMADEVLLSAFVVVVVGGLGSVWGAVAGGLVLGVVEGLGSAYLSSAYQSAFGFLLLVLILVLKPGGLRGATGRRVA